MKLFKLRTKNLEHLGKSRLYFGLFFLGITSSIHSQYDISVGINYISAFGKRSIDLQNTTYFLNNTQGYEVTLNNSYHFTNRKVETIFKVGFRQLYFSGYSTNLTYNGQLNKLVGAAGLNYLVTEEINLSSYLEIENNLDLDEFNAGNGDLFRLSLSLEGKYKISEKLGLTCLFSCAMTPISEVYILINPQYQVRLGLTYQITK
ncbi:MAG: hypothetical protein MK066_05070 [Crocinitomicaceae bacterium]|nr:hypothetical protein [Crocinitomicaceae bacterium]